MAITKFVPELWSARLVAALEKAHVANAFVNKDYEGMITGQGDTVHITSINNIAINQYVKGTPITTQDLTDTDTSLQITEADYFSFAVDDIDKVQSAGDLIDAAMSNAAYGLNDKSDTFLFATMAAGVASSNKLTTVKLTTSNIYEKIVELRLLLDKANVPTQSRAIAIPPEAYALLLQDNRFVGTGGADAEGTLKSGLVGKVAGFDVYETNNLPESSGEYSIIASVPSATTYAEQIAKTEAFRQEAQFADGVKGLHVYGAKVIDGKKIAVLPATF